MHCAFYSRAFERYIRGWLKSPQLAFSPLRARLGKKKKKEEKAVSFHFFKSNYLLHFTCPEELPAVFPETIDND